MNSTINMIRKNHILFLGLVFFIMMTSPVLSDIDQYMINYYIPVFTGPNITSWSNSKTLDNSQNINLNVGENIKFNVSADQTILTWRWYKDGIIQTNNYDNFTTTWTTTGTKIISVNGSNINGTTNTIIWNINVLNQTNLASCGALNVSNSVYVLNSNISSSGTCFTIGANNITLEGNGKNINYAITTAGYGISDLGGYSINIRNLTFNQQNAAVANSYGIYLRNVINSRADNININTKNNAEGLYLSSSSSNTFSNITISTANNGAYGIYLASSNSNIFSKCNIKTVGSNSDGIYMTTSSSNIFSGCNITTTGGNGEGIYMGSSNYNSYSGLNILTSGTGANGIRLNLASSNIAKDGSIISKLANDYYLQNSATNSFINTNFTTRKIYFADSNSLFNYSNNNIWLKTNQPTSSNKGLTITRTLVNWQQTNISWQEKLSAAKTLNYGVAGLLPNTRYSVWNDSGISYNLTTDINGNLPNFTINITTALKVIKVISG